jgi:hypothetical protein
MAESPRAGVYDGVAAFRTSYLAAPGGHFTCPLGWQFGGWTSVYTASMFPHGVPGFPSIARSSNGRVGIAVADFGGNVYLIESSNGTFAAGTLTTRTLTSYTDASITAPDSTSTQFRPYIHCHVAYNDTTPNVVWSELQARRIGGVIQSFDWHSRIVHWDPIRGAQVVKQVAQGEADQYDNVDRGLKGPLPGQNAITVDWPQVGFSADGAETYVAWLRFSDAEVDTSAHMNLAGICTGVGFADIAASVARAGGPWSAAAEPDEHADDGRALLLARGAQPGRSARTWCSKRRPRTRRAARSSAIAARRRSCCCAGSRTSSGRSRRAWWTCRPSPRRRSSHVDDRHAQPAASRVRFSLAAGSSAFGAVDVYGVGGRRVATVAALAQRHVRVERPGRVRPSRRGRHLLRASGGCRRRATRALHAASLMP